DEFDRNVIAKPESLPGALAQKLMLGGVVVEIVGPEFGDMHQAFHVNLVQGDEDAEAGYTADSSGEALADPILHVVTLEPGLDVPCSFIGPTLRIRAVRAQILPVARIVVRAGEHCLDRAMDEQIRVAPDGRSKMRVSLIRQFEMAHVIGTVNGLTKRTQHHRLQQLHVGSCVDLLQQPRVILGLWVLPAGKLKNEYTL